MNYTVPLRLWLLLALHLLTSFSALRNALIVDEVDVRDDSDGLGGDLPGCLHSIHEVPRPHDDL